MGVSPKDIAGALRISFSEYTTDDEIEFAAEKIAEESAMILRYM